MLNKLRIGGYFDVECVNPDGSVAWRERLVLNSVTNAGLNHILATELAAGTQVTAWFLGLVDNSGFSAFSANDTMGTHAGWTELQSYSETVRQTWTPGAVAGQSVTNPSPATFTANANVSIVGMFLVSNSAKGGVAGTLFATGAFPGGVQGLNNGQVLKATYTCGATSS